MAEVKEDLREEQVPGTIGVGDVATELAALKDAPKPKQLRPLWFQRDYMLLWSGQVVSSLGSGMSGIAFPLLILVITGSPLVAGIAGALGALPYPIFSLPVGALMDRWDRKKVMIICDTVRAINIASIPIALYFGVLTVWQIYLNSFIEGSAFVFFNIAEVAALPRVVDKAQLPAAAAQNEAAYGIVGLISPSVGALLFKSVSQLFPFIFDAISYSASIISLSLIKTRFQAERTKRETKLRGEIKEGLVWLWSRPLIRTMAFLTGGLNLVSSASFLTLILLAKRLGADEPSIGVIFSIGAVGGIIGSIIGGFIQKRFSFGQVIIAAVWVDVLMFPLYLVAPNIVVLGAINAIMWMMNPVYNVVQFSYRLALIPDRLQGRVNSAFRLIAWGSQPLGAALAGVLLQFVGVEYTVITFAVVLFILGIAAAINSHIRHAKPIEQVQSEG
jgi:predicted MFS family arabinose efflux permease